MVPDPIHKAWTVVPQQSTLFYPVACGFQVACNIHIVGFSIRNLTAYTENVSRLREQGVIMNKRFSIMLVIALMSVATVWTQETQLKRYTTYQTSLTKEDIMRSFVNEVAIYLQRYDNYDCYYWVGFDVYQDKDKQNYAWMTSTNENTYQWGTVYTIRLLISNADLWVKFSNTSFTQGNESAHEIVTTRLGTVGGNRIRNYITEMAASMFAESEMVLKMYNDNYSDTSKKAFLLNIARLLFL
jgi:hypothetical protein